MLDQILAEVDADHVTPTISRGVRQHRSTSAGCAASPLWDGARPAPCSASTRCGRCSRRSRAGRARDRGGRSD